MVELSPLWLSIRVALVATLIVAPPGIVTAWWLSHGKPMRGKSVIETILSLPLVLPPTVVGFYLLMVFGRGTSLGRWVNEFLGIHVVFTWQGATIAAAVMSFPLFLRAATSAFASVDQMLLEAGRTLGASESKILFNVIVPVSYRGILAGLVLAFARALGEFGATIMLAGSIPGQTQTLPLALYDSVQLGKQADATVYTLILSITAFAVLVGTGIYQGSVARKRGE